MSFMSVHNCQVSRNIVMLAHLIRPAHFTGMSCTAYQRREGSGVNGLEGQESPHEQQLHFRCMAGAHNTSLNNFPLKVRPISTATVTVTAPIFGYVAPGLARVSSVLLLR